MATISEALEMAVAHHQAGRLQQAEQIYRQVLQAQPRHPGAHHLMGLLAIQVGRYDTAVELICNAIRLDGFQAVYHANLGEAYRGLGRMAEAKVCYEQALRIQENFVQVRHKLASLLQFEGQLPAAIAQYQRVVAERPDNADAQCDLASVLVEAGQWDAAIAACRRAIEIAPNHAIAHHNLGAALNALGQHEAACAALERAVALRPGFADAHFGLGMALQARKLWDRAAAQFEEALRVRPSYVAALNSLGTVLQAQGRLDEAIERYQQAVRIAPSCAEAHYNLGTALGALGRREDAVAAYRRAIEHSPMMADAHYNLGTTLQDMGRYPDAEAAYLEAVRLRPDFAQAYNNLGNVYRWQDRALEALACYERALAIDPNHGDAHNNRGSVLLRQGHMAEAFGCFRQALRCKSDFADAYNNLGAALQEQGQFVKALAAYDKAIRLRPEFAEARYNRALVHLSRQNFVDGWAEFDWRLRCRDYTHRHVGQAAWDGSPLAGRTLLVHAEQGLGDTLQFVRYLPAVRKLGGRLILEVQPAMVGLLQLSGFVEAVAWGTPLPPFDVQAPLASLPKLFGATLENLPAEVPYLAADPPLVDAWRRRLAAFDGFKVGIHWQGNRAYAFDRLRSIPLREFTPLAAIEGVQLFSLQKGFGREQLAELAGSPPVNDLSAQLDEQTGAFMDTAAVMKNLDLVITSDTATAHLAGALGVKVWVALTRWPDWRWFLDRQDSPWYPTMRLFRQARLGDWAEVFGQIAAELALASSGRWS